jgi:regulator of sigma E protease
MELDKEVENGFNTKKAYQRFIVLFAGVFMNLVLAYLIFFSQFWITGKTNVEEGNRVVNIFPKTEAARILKKEDKILAIDGEETKTWEDIYTKLESKKEAEIDIKVERENKEILIKGNLNYDEENSRYLLGISPFSKNRYGFLTSTKKAVLEMNKIVGLTFKGLGMLVTGQVSRQEISGPVGVVKAVKVVAVYGAEYIFYFAAIISISLAIFNLLPIPALDGGRILFIILEMLGVKVNKKLEERIHRIGLIILLVLMLLITVNDIANWGTPIN